MLTTKKTAGSFPGLALGLLAAGLVAGCQPTGPGSLLEGAKLIDERKYDKAIKKLKIATELLPQNAQAWNHLGLACHGAGLRNDAAQAYQQAIQKDRNLPAPRYNLGCLQLEQNNASAAVDTLGAFCVLQPQQVEGWLKLATAQLGAQKLNEAERSFNQVLKLSARNPEALNGLGVVQFHRRRAREAFQYFNNAVTERSDYGPALLNMAVVAQQSLNSRAFALQKYREYLALKPAPPNCAAVRETARQLDLELNPPAHPQISNVPTQSPGASNLVTLSNNRIATTGQVAVASLTNRPPAFIPTQSVKPDPSTNLVKSNVPDGEKIDPHRRVEVVRLPDEPPSKPAQDDLLVASIPRTADPIQTVLSPSTNAAASGIESPMASPDESEKDKPGFFQRLNPVNWFRSKQKTHSGRATTPLATGITVISLSTNNGAGSGTTPPAIQPVARYSYRASAKPAAGNRSAAERSFAQGVQQQKQNRLAAAIESYQEAARLDPSFFDAHYNLGLAAYESGELARSLTAYESALSLTPGSVNARYNFALALQQANYPRDAANELEKILERSSDETRAHLTLANLYAQQLNQPSLARLHYLKVLQSEPRHAQAAAIRYWLASNP